MESDGVTKRYRCKIEGIQMDAEWAVSWAGAGDAHVIDKFTDKLRRSLGHLEQRYSRADIELAVEAALTLVHQDHPKEAIQIVLALWGTPVTAKSRTFAAERLLYRGRSDNQCIARETEYCLGGMDVTLANFVLRNTFRRSANVDEAMRLGVFVTSLMKEYADGVGGDTNVIACRRGKFYWDELSQEQVASIEADMPLKDLEILIGKYWDEKRKNK